MTPNHPSTPRGMIVQMCASALLVLVLAGCDRSEPTATPTPQPMLVEVASQAAPALSATVASPPGVSASAARSAPSAGPPSPILRATQWTFKSNVHHEVACSQSFESSQEVALYRLSLTPPNRATLHVEVSYMSTFGPSPGRYMSGSRDFHTNRRSRVLDWTGKARWLGEQLELVLDEGSRCTTPGATGSAECNALALSTIRCIPTKQKVAAKVAPGGAEDEKTTDETVLTCPEIKGITTLEIAQQDPLGLHFHSKTPIARELEYGHLAMAGRHRAELRFFDPSQP